MVGIDTADNMSLSDNNTPSESEPEYTVLVTGSSGHLGHALMLMLPSLGYTPLGLDIVPTPHTTVVGNITDTHLISSILTSHPTITAIVHSATLHKPHVDSHTKADFIDTNVSGTLNLLEAAVSPTLTDKITGKSRIRSFLFISTTSTFGSALSPKPGSPEGAAWIDETVVPIPKNIYGVTKCAAEDLCHLFHRQYALPTVVLRTSRFFPEADDDEDRRASMEDSNLKVCELAYRRVDVSDVVGAVVCALRKTAEGTVGWGKYIISAPPPFAHLTSTPDGKAELRRRLDRDAPGALQDAVPGAKAVFDQMRWKFLPRLDRVYDSSKAVRELGWTPEYTFERVMEKLRKGEDWRSPLTYEVGKKGYHAVPTGVYTTEARGV